MKDKNKLFFLILFIFFGINTTMVFGHETKKPNILYILVDQWRAQALGYAGDKNAITPYPPHQLHLYKFKILG